MRKTVFLDPQIVFAVSEHHLRRNSDQSRVVGGLIGTVSDDGRQIDVKNSFPMLHKLKEGQVQLEASFLHEMYEMSTKVLKKQQFLGFYITGPALNESIKVFSDFFQSEFPNAPLVLHVDTSFETETPGIHAYNSAKVSIGHHLTKIPLRLKYFEGELAGLEAIYSDSQLKSDISELQTSVEFVGDILKQIHSYLKSVVNGKVKPNAQIGRFILDTLYSLPADSDAQVSDLSRVQELIQSAKTQLKLADELQLK